MLSLGIYAVFLHPVEALHGDLGVVHANDVVLALSYSGNTDELMRIVPSLAHRNVPLIGLGGNPKSQLAKCSQAWIDAQVSAEVSAIPAPTSSTTLALALGDAIAITIAHERKFTTHGFALNHPGGSLGRRLLLKVEDAMVPVAQTATVTAVASLDVVIMAMTRHPRSGGVIVVRNVEEEESTLDSPPASDTSEQDDSDDGTQKQMVIGIITHDHIHQILKTAPRESIFDIKAADIMSPEPVLCGTRDLAVEAYKRMTAGRVKELALLPVIDTTDKRTPLMGVVTLKDLQELF
ncbi:hypothetical protein BX666DRAFT_1865841 [Dichotomocladium elegans]|nr:hypothetical protein BX666DRAFT_1865841 [Dichotomocladium elegans]